MLLDSDKQRIKIAGIIFILFFTAYTLYYIITYRHYTQGTIETMHWQRAIQLLQYQTFHESAWDESVPSNAYNRNSKWEWRSSYQRYSYSTYQTVDCGTRKNPRTCRKETKHYDTVNVYDYKVYYDINRWVNIPPLIASGTSKELVAWPNNPYPQNAPDNIGNIKSGALREEYTISINAEGKNYRYTCPNYDYWRALYTGKNMKLTLGFFNNIIEIGE